MRRHILLGLQFGRQFQHRDIRLGIDALEQRRQIGRQFAATRRTVLAGRCSRSRRRFRLGQIHREARAHIIPPGGRPPRPSALYLRLNTLAEVNRTRLSPPGWPHFPARLLNQTFQPLGIPLDSLFKLDGLAPAGSDRHRERPVQFHEQWSGLLRCNHERRHDDAWIGTLGPTAFDRRGNDGAYNPLVTAALGSPERQLSRALGTPPQAKTDRNPAHARDYQVDGKKETD